MSTVKVRNAIGTSQHRSPDGSWLTTHQIQSRQTIKFCSNYVCAKEVAVGGHVHYSNYPIREWYIVPLCEPCNALDGEFEIWRSTPMVRVK